MLESSRDPAARLLAAEECYSAKECYSANNQFHVNHKPLPNWQYQYQYQSLQRQSGSQSHQDQDQDHNPEDHHQDHHHQLTLTLVPLLPKAPERNKMFYQIWNKITLMIICLLFVTTRSLLLQNWGSL